MPPKRRAPSGKEELFEPGEERQVRRRLEALEEEQPRRAPSFHMTLRRRDHRERREDRRQQRVQKRHTPWCYRRRRRARIEEVPEEDFGAMVDTEIANVETGEEEEDLDGSDVYAIPSNYDVNNPRDTSDRRVPRVKIINRWLNLRYAQVIIKFQGGNQFGRRQFRQYMKYVLLSALERGFVSESYGSMSINFTVFRTPGGTPTTSVIALPTIIYNNKAKDSNGLPNPAMYFNITKIIRFWIDKWEQKTESNMGYEYWEGITQVQLTSMNSYYHGQIRQEPWFDGDTQNQPKSLDWMEILEGDEIPVTERRLYDPDTYGYCEDGRGKKVVLHGHVMYSAKGKHGECFFRAADQLLRSQGKRIDLTPDPFTAANRYLTANNIPVLKREAVAIPDIDDLIGFLQCEVEVLYFNEENELEVIYSSETDRTASITLVFHEGHYYAYHGPFAHKSVKGTRCERCKKYYLKPHNCDQVQCPSCSQWRKTLNGHVCNVKLVSMTNYIHSRRHKRLLSANVQFMANFPGMKEMAFFDLETTRWNSAGLQYCYAMGVMDFTGGGSEGRYFESYGVDAIHVLSNWLFVFDNPSKRLVLVGYNNALFDNHMLLTSLLQKHQEPKLMLQGASCLLKLEWTNPRGVQVHIIDLYRFTTQGSLRQNCKDFGIGIAKGEFPHKWVSQTGFIYGKYPIPGKEYWGDSVPENFDSLTPEERAAETWDVKEECLKYLRQDVECTARLYEVIAKVIHDKFAVNLNHFVTLSHLAYSVWSAMLCVNTNKNSDGTWKFGDAAPNKQTAIKIVLPDICSYAHSIKATYGGMVYPVKSFFESPHFSDIMMGKIKWEDLQENYIQNTDIVSLYPWAMSSFDYPVDSYKHLTEKQIQDINVDIRRLPTGIFKVKYQPRKNLIIPVLPHRDVEFDRYGRATSKGLEHDLVDGVDDFYTSWDLECAIDAGYKITILSGIYWEKTYPVFQKYISLCFEMKKLGDETGNEALRQIFKLLMNSLFGKMLQQPQLRNAAVVQSTQKADEFLAKHIVTSVETLDYLNEDLEKQVCAIFEGVDPRLTRKINKPTYYGAFILSGARKRMYFFRKILNEWEGKEIDKALHAAHFYGDTDSMHILMTKEIIERLAPFSDRSVLGNFVNDNKEGGKIFKAIYLAPKSYCIYYLLKNNSIKIVCKDKGKPQRTLKPSYYDKALKRGEETVVSFEAFEKSGIRSRGNNPPFSVVIHPITRKVSQLYDGRTVLNKHPNLASVPLGFDFNQIPPQYK